MSQVLVLPPLHHSNDEVEEEETKSCNSSNDVKQNDNLKSSEKLTAALVAIMRQQQMISKIAPPATNNIEKEGGDIERAIEIDAAEALERRMKQMELSMPQKVEAMLDEGINEVKDAMGDLLAEVSESTE